MDFLKKIKQNNETHIVNNKELNDLMSRSNKVYSSNFNSDVWFERSVFINWTCAIADCKYCYLSTQNKYDPKTGTKALRSKASILAEILICKSMGFKIGYITGGLRVEKTEYLIDLMTDVNKILCLDNKVNNKVKMNFGPYSKNIIEKFKPVISGMGVAIESFDKELHDYICPSKPLHALMNTLKVLKENNMKKIITIILGMGEKRDDVYKVIEKIKEYEIDQVQLCFLKPQEKTVFNEVPAPNPEYMAWWIAKIRIECPKLIIKIALVRERINDFSLYLKAGANCFSRFLVFKDFNTKFAKDLEKECKKANRNLLGNFTKVAKINVEKLVSKLDFDDNLKEKIVIKANEYYDKLKKGN